MRCRGGFSFKIMNENESKKPEENIPEVTIKPPSDEVVNMPEVKPEPPEKKKKEKRDLEIAFSELELKVASQGETIKTYEKKLSQLLSTPKGKSLWEEIEEIWS